LQGDPQTEYGHDQLSRIAGGFIGRIFAASRANATLTFTNGNFSSFSNATTGVPSQLGDSGTGGYTKLTGWTVGQGSSGLLAFLIASSTADTTGSHDVRFNDTFLLWGANDGGLNTIPASSPNGGNYVALDADTTYSGSGISQQLGGLVAGQKYAVSFYWAASQQHGFDGATTESVRVGFGTNTPTTATYNLASHAFSGWMPKRLSSLLRLQPTRCRSWPWEARMDSLPSLSWTA
jgi:hypothetical protein